MHITPLSMPKGRSLNDFLPLSPGEEGLLLACRLGEEANLGQMPPELCVDDNRVRGSFLRFLALGGDDQAPVHEHGVQIRGAWISGVLDLEAARVPSNLTLYACKFDTAPIFRDGQVDGSLMLIGCHVPGIEGDRLVCGGGLFLRTEFVATGTVSILGIQLGGVLDCTSGRFRGDDRPALRAERGRIWGGIYLRNSFFDGEVSFLDTEAGGLDCLNATFKGSEGYALTADRAVTRGDVALNQGFKAFGRVSLLGARISGDIRCEGGTFHGAVFHEDREIAGIPISLKEWRALLLDRAEVKGSVFLTNGFSATGLVSLDNVRIGGSLDCEGAMLDGKEGLAFTADGIVINGRFVFRRILPAVNRVSLSSSHVGYLADDMDSWGKDIILDEFRYDGFAEDAPTDAASRLTWLKKQPATHLGITGNCKHFKPQPWEQLIRSLRSIGHAEDARQVAIERERHQRRIGIIGQTPPEWGKPRSWAYRQLMLLFHRLLGLLVVYGYRPIRLFVWMIAVWLSCAAFYWIAAQQGVFAPTNPLVFQHSGYAHCRPNYQPELNVGTARQKVGNWFLCADLAEEYTGFSPLAYSLDLLLPLVDLQQERDWAPMIPTPKAIWHRELTHLTLKHWVRLSMWFEILFGWGASLLLVAVFTGLVNRDRG